MRPRLAVIVLVAVFLAAAHLVLEASARFAETRLAAFLWKRQDYVRLFEASNYVGLGPSRLLIYGPSEAREGLLPEELEVSVPGLKPYQHSQSIGTLEDGLLVLRYIERAYGPSAVPAALLLGITPRFIGDIRLGPSPLQNGIARYSPHFRLGDSGHPPPLLQRTGLESIGARISMLRIQPDRYRRGLLAIASRIVTTVAPSLGDQRWTWVHTRPAKYLVGRWEEKATKTWLAAPGNFWEAVHNWDPEQSRERVTRELEELLAFAAKYDMKLYVVNLPELSWNSSLFKPERYEAYLSIVKEALGTTPFLDLRTFLADEDFFDDAHPAWPAAIRVSRRVGQFIAEHHAPEPGTGRQK